MLRPSAPDLKVYMHRVPIDLCNGRNARVAMAREVMQKDRTPLIAVARRVSDCSRLHAPSALTIDAIATLLPRAQPEPMDRRMVGSVGDLTRYEFTTFDRGFKSFRGL